MDNELYELKKCYDKEQGKAYFNFVMIILICGFSVLNIWPMIDEFITGYDFLGAVIKLGTLIGCELFPVINFFKIVDKCVDFQSEIINLEDNIEQKKIIKKISKRFNSLSLEKQEDFLRYVDNNLNLDEIYEELEGLDYENMLLLKNELKLLVDNSNAGNVEQKDKLDDLRCNMIEYVFEEIESWKNDDFMYVMCVVLEDIRNDKELLRYYLPEVDWDIVDIDFVYNKLFEEKNINFEYLRTKKKEL